MIFWRSFRAVGFFLGLSFVAATAGCSHSLHLHHISDFGPSYAAYQEGRWVKSEAEQFVIMGFVRDTEYVDQAWKRLQKQCDGGQVQGVQTEYSTDHGFFSWTNRIRMQGLCLKKS